MPPRQSNKSFETQLKEAERKGREEGRKEGHKEGMGDMFALLSAADAGESQACLLRTNCHSDVIYFRARVSIAMIEAVEKNDLELIHFFLEAGADINFFDDNDRTALQLAVFSGQIELVNTLLKAGADPNIAIDITESPVRIAVEEGNRALAKILLAADADVNNGRAPEEGGWLIDSSTEGDHADMTEILLEAGAFVGTDKYKYLWTPLMSAYHCKPRSVALLIKAGCDVNAQTRDSGTVLMLPMEIEKE